MYKLYKEEKRYGLKDPEDNIILSAEYEEIVVIPNYFDLLFNTFQPIYRLRKSIAQHEFIYFQPGHPERNAQGIYSELVTHKVYYFYKNYSLLDWDGNDIKRLCIDGTCDEISYADNTPDTINFYGLIRCDDIVKISGKYEPICWDDEITETDSDDLIGYQLDLNTLPGYLGFYLHKNQDGISFLYVNNLTPTSSEHSIGLGRPYPLGNSYIDDYSSLGYTYISEFDVNGLSLVQDPITNKKAYINRYFIRVTDWFDQEVGNYQLQWLGLRCHEDEKYVIKDNRLLKLKLSGDFIADILVNTQKFFESYTVAKHICELSNKSAIPEKSVYCKIDRKLAKRILGDEGFETSEENIQNVYKREDFIEELKLVYDYFFVCIKHLNAKEDVDWEYLIELHHEEFGVIPSYSYIHSDFGPVAEGQVDFFRGE
jgi:hypothetical protein